MPYVLSCSTYLVPYMFLCFMCLVPYMPSCLKCLVSYLLLCFRCLVPYAASCLVLYEPFYWRTLLFCTLRILVLITPFAFLSSMHYASIFLFICLLLVIFFWKFIEYSLPELLWRDDQYLYDIFELFETNCENIYIWNYFGTGEGEFKARYNNHKKLFTPFWENSSRTFKFTWNLKD